MLSLSSYAQDKRERKKKVKKMEKEQEKIKNRETLSSTKGSVWDPVSETFVTPDRKNKHEVVRFDSKEWGKKKARGVVKNKHAKKGKKKKEKEGDNTLDSGSENSKSKFKP